MDMASTALTDYLKDKNPGIPKIPVYANTTAQIYDDVKGLLAKQVKSPVLWQKTVENMIKDGFDTFIEVGAGKTLSGLIKKISGTVTVLNVCDKNSLENTVLQLAGALR
jgi:[acyl-carrier-protein] S-malonyltransferase